MVDSDDLISLLSCIQSSALIKQKSSVCGINIRHLVSPSIPSSSDDGIKKPQVNVVATMVARLTVP